MFLHKYVKHHLKSSTVTWQLSRLVHKAIFLQLDEIYISVIKRNKTKYKICYVNCPNIRQVSPSAMDSW